MVSATVRQSGGREGQGDQEARGDARGRGLELLRVLFDARHPLGVTAIAAAMGTTRGAAHSLLRDLERGAFVHHDPDGAWSLPAGGVVSLSPRLVGRLHLRAAARPIIERIAARTGETVSVYVRNRLHGMRLDAVDGQPPRIWLPLGETLPLYDGISGRVILAHLPRPAVAAVLADAGLDADAERVLRVHLARARRQGYLASTGQRRPDLTALSVPVFGSSGIGAAVSVAGPADRWDQDAMERAAPWVRIECAALSATLGSLPPLE